MPPSDTAKSLQGAISEILNFPIFRQCPREKIEALCRSGQVIVSNHRQRVFDFGDPGTYFGIVLGGAYKLSRPTPSGEDSIVHFAAPGDVIAAFIMTQSQPRFPVTATAMGPSRFLKIPRETYLELWRTDVDLIARIQADLSSRMSLLQMQKALNKAPLTAKIASLLMDLVARQGNEGLANEEKDESGLIIPIPLTRKEIADNLGVTTESVIRVMSDWSKEGYVTTNERQISILRPDQLIHFIHGESSN